MFSRRHQSPLSSPPPPPPRSNSRQPTPIITTTAPQDGHAHAAATATSIAQSPDAAITGGSPLDSVSARTATASPSSASSRHWASWATDGRASPTSSVTSQSSRDSQCRQKYHNDAQHQQPGYYQNWRIAEQTSAAGRASTSTSDEFDSTVGSGRTRKSKKKLLRAAGSSRRSSRRPAVTAAKLNRWPSPSALLPSNASATAGMLVSLPRVLRREAVALVAEFCGTFSFLVLALCATQLVLGNERGAEDGRLGTAWLGFGSVFLISLAWGASAALNLWLFNPLSGGMFNPAVTIGLVATGTIPPLRAILLLVPAQLGAGIAAAAATAKLTPGPLRVATNISGFLDFTQAWFVEMLLTAQLVFAAFLLLGAGRAKAQAALSSLSVPLGIGFSVFVAHLVGTNFTGAAMNPARSLGTDLATGFKFGFWIYYGGPMTGTAIAFAVYVALGWIEGYLDGSSRDVEEDIERGCGPTRSRSRCLA